MCLQTFWPWPQRPTSGALHNCLKHGPCHHSQGWGTGSAPFRPSCVASRRHASSSFSAGRCRCAPNHSHTRPSTSTSAHFPSRPSALAWAGTGAVQGALSAAAYAVAGSPNWPKTSMVCSEPATDDHKQCQPRVRVNAPPPLHNQSYRDCFLILFLRKKSQRVPFAQIRPDWDLQSLRQLAALPTSCPLAIQLSWHTD